MYTKIKKITSFSVSFLIFLLTFSVTTSTVRASYLPGGEQYALSSFTTKYNAGNVARVQNIKLAVKAINGYVVFPGETFSYNETIGPTSENRGFKMAKVIIKGKESKGYGGGVCQVSSTLYNAALDAGLTIIERHPHSKKVPYVPEGKDAATSYGGIDLKFKNDFDVPVMILASTAKNGVTVSIAVF